MVWLTPISPRRWQRIFDGSARRIIVRSDWGQSICLGFGDSRNSPFFSTFAQTFDREIGGNLLWLLDIGERSDRYSEARKTNFPCFRGKSSRLDVYVSERIFFNSLANPTAYKLAEIRSNRKRFQLNKKQNTTCQKSTKNKTKQSD